MRVAAAIVIVAVACVGGGRTGLDPTRFAPRPEWTADRYRIPQPAPPVDPATRLSADDVIDDVAYLEHALTLAWADGPDGTAWGLDYARDRMRELAARGPMTAAGLCEQLVDWLRNTALRFTLAGDSCNTIGRAAEPDRPPLYPARPGRHYTWHVDGEGTDAALGVLAITAFAAPDDPGWSGFDRVLRDLAAIDLVVIDLRAAAGDDPRLGLAVLAALGLERYQVVHPPELHDGALAGVARANLARTRTVTPRDRALWSQLGTIDDLHRIARAHTDAARTAPSQVVLAAIVVGAGCGKACQLIAALAERNHGHVAITGWAPGPGGDEPGLVRLPHSGIEVQFATAWYWGTHGVGSFSSDADPVAARDLVRTAATTNPEAVAWRDRPLPDCAALPVAPAPQLGGCASTLPTDPTAEVGMMISLSVDEDIARAFLATCPGLTTETVLFDPVKRRTLGTLTAPVGTLRKLASSPLPLYLEGGCPMYPERDETPDDVSD